jgi:hypothetical protein
MFISVTVVTTTGGELLYKTCGYDLIGVSFAAPVNSLNARRDLIPPRPFLFPSLSPCHA